MDEPFKETEIKIAVLGGGTGSFVVLSSLKKYTSQIAAIVNMADDGGSSGVLRDQLGVLPPGDVRQCLVALSEVPKMRDLFNYRFEDGTFGGHSFGNILLTALEKVTGNFSEAIRTASDILRVRGIVIPGTLDNVRLKMTWKKQKYELLGENNIGSSKFLYSPKLAELTLDPNPVANPMALKAISEADMVVVAPGGIYTSVGPLLSIPGVGEALMASHAKKVYVVNLVTKIGQADGFSVIDHVNEIERMAGTNFLDYVLYNDQKPTRYQVKKYRAEGDHITRIKKGNLKNMHYKLVSGKLLGNIAIKKNEDNILPVTRSLIRHNEEALGTCLMNIYYDHKDTDF
jgi:uncharacterized cofD-like protein